MSDSPYIHNVGLQDFQNLVLENSMKQPVLVDFWADWCAPCKQIMPILTKLVEEYGGKFHLAKINADEQQELAGHLGIRSLPNMKLIVNGQIAAEKTGAVPEAEIRAMLDAHIVNESEQMMQAAAMAYQQGNTEQALEIMNQALAKDPENAALKVEIARVVHAQGDTQSATALLDSLNDDDAKLDAAVQLRTEIEMAATLADLPDINEIENRLQDNPKDLEALMAKSHILTAQGHYEPALQCLLTIMQTDREFEEDAGRLGLLKLFDLLGGDHPLVQQYRRKLFTLLH